MGETMAAAFERSCEARGIHLTAAQTKAAGVLLEAIRDGDLVRFFTLRGTGTSFLLHAIEEFFLEGGEPDA